MIGYKLDNLRLQEYTLSRRTIDVDASYELGAGSALICTISGRSFYKRNSGWAIAAYWYRATGYTGPILVSTQSDYVTYYTTYDYSDLFYEGTIDYDGTTYYYSATGQYMAGNQTDTSGTGRQKLTATASVTTAATELLNRYFKNGY